MPQPLNRKGVALLMVSGVSLIIFMGILLVLFILQATTANVSQASERAVAYYLCETGASVAIIDIGEKRIGKGPGQWTQRTFSFDCLGKIYKIRYKITKESGQWSIVSEVGPGVDLESDLTRTYALYVRGQRAFPIFIRGFGGR